MNGGAWPRITPRSHTSLSPLTDRLHSVTHTRLLSASIQFLTPKSTSVNVKSWKLLDLMALLERRMGMGCTKINCPHSLLRHVITCSLQFKILLYAVCSAVVILRSVHPNPPPLPLPSNTFLSTLTIQHAILFTTIFPRSFIFFPLSLLFISSFLILSHFISFFFLLSSISSFNTSTLIPVLSLYSSDTSIFANFQKN